MKFIGEILRKFYTNLHASDGFDIMLAAFLAGLTVTFIYLVGIVFLMMVKELGAVGIGLSFSFVVFFVFFVVKM